MLIFTRDANKYNMCIVCLNVAPYAFLVKVDGALCVIVYEKNSKIRGLLRSGRIFMSRFLIIKNYAGGLSDNCTLKSTQPACRRP